MSEEIQQAADRVEAWLDEQHRVDPSNQVGSGQTSKFLKPIHLASWKAFRDQVTEEVNNRGRWVQTEIRVNKQPWLIWTRGGK